MKKVNFMKTILPRAGAGAGSNQKRAAPGGSGRLRNTACCNMCSQSSCTSSHDSTVWESPQEL